MRAGSEGHGSSRWSVGPDLGVGPRQRQRGACRRCRRGVHAVAMRRPALSDRRPGPRRRSGSLPRHARPHMQQQREALLALTGFNHELARRAEAASNLMAALIRL